MATIPTAVNPSTITAVIVPVVVVVVVLVVCAIATIIILYQRINTKFLENNPKQSCMTWQQPQPHPLHKMMGCTTTPTVDDTALYNSYHIWYKILYTAL